MSASTRLSRTGSALATLGREDADLPARLARSAADAGPSLAERVAGVHRWLSERRQAHSFRVTRIPFDELQNWSFEPATGNLVHRSGGFFTVEGLDVAVPDGPVPHWQQPIIRQPETGILGLLAQERGGVLRFLMQAKMEPGNPNLVQLSPTVQATRSNYTAVHKGTPVRYLEYFRDLRCRVIADVLQSEHGSWFYHKANRNMIVETQDDVPEHEDFRWLTLSEIAVLLRQDLVVNMDARTALACAPIAGDAEQSLLTGTQLLSWFTGERSRHQTRAVPMPLAEVDGWHRGAEAVEHRLGRYFRVVTVAVEAANREVTGWHQPLFEPCGTGVTAFLVRNFGGTPHLLAHARVEAGFLDTVELGPSVQYTPENYAGTRGADRPPYLDEMLAAGPAAIRYEARHSEEGGRFLNAVSRYLFVDADKVGVPAEPLPGYQWVTPGQLSALVRHGHYVNVQARTLLACLTTGAVTL
jgi:oxidase EvaA